MFGPVSHIQYCIEMLNFPNVQTVDGMITKKLKEKKENAKKKESGDIPRE